MSSVTIQDLAGLWPSSHGDPYSLVQQDDPPGEAGTYVIEPGERVPESGYTSHAGTEVSVILAGELRLVTDEPYHVGPESLVVIPAGTEHYSENVGETAARLVYAILGEL